MKYCTNCLMPETRPRITFNENGICNACEWAGQKEEVDWESREKNLIELIETSKKRNPGKFQWIFLQVRKKTVLM